MDVALASLAAVFRFGSSLPQTPQGRDEPSLKTAAKEATVFPAVNMKKNPFERSNFRKFMAYLRLEEEDMLTIGAYTFQSYL